MAASARSTVQLSHPLAVRIQAESERRGVPVAAIVDEAVAAYLDDDGTDESVIAVGADVPLEEAARPVSARGAQAIRDLLASPAAPPPALRKLLRGL